MSKYSEDMQSTFKNVEAIKKATRSIIGKTSKDALKEYHDAKSLEILKKMIREK